MPGRARGRIRYDSRCERRTRFAPRQVLGMGAGAALVLALAAFAAPTAAVAAAPVGSTAPARSAAPAAPAGSQIVVGSTASAGPAHSRSHGHLPTAVVTLGDSYMSGEAGRWKGNAATTDPGRLGTDRAWRPASGDPAGTVDPARVYGDTGADGGCHRSDVAQVKSAWLAAGKAVNLACSGAKTVNVLRASAGGVSYKGELPQDDQLAAVAKTHRVRAVVLLIGGNDLGFGSLVTACVGAYLYGAPACNTSLQPVIAAGLPQMGAAVGATVDDIRATLATAGYAANDYRLILESYPNPLAASTTSRYSGSAPDARAAVGGCPFYDADADWAHATVIPAMRAQLAAVAKSRDVQFLDISDAFRGHELCAATAAQSTGHPRSASSEWVRFIDLTGQGDSSESLHPNYFGQRALGECLTLALLARHDVACHGTAHLPSRAVYLTPLT